MTRRGTRRSERPQSPGFLVTARALSLSLLAAAVLLIAACSTSDTNAGESVAEECSWCLTSKEPDTATPDGVLSADLIVMLDAVRANTALHDIADWVAVADIQSVCGRVADQDGAESVDAAARALATARAVAIGVLDVESADAYAAVIIAGTAEACARVAQ